MDLPVAPEGLDILLHPGYQAVRAVERLVLRNNHYVCLCNLSDSLRPFCIASILPMCCMPAQAVIVHVVVDVLIQCRRTRKGRLGAPITVGAARASALTACS